MTLTQFLPGGRTAGLIVALTMTASLAACSSSDSDESSGASGGTMSEQSAEDTDRSFGAQSEGDAAAPADKAGSASVTRTALQTPAIERHVISTGTVSLVSEDVAEARRDVQRIVDAQQGTVTQENTETDDEGVATYSRLVIRVPSSSFAATVLSLEKAAELRTSQVSSEDVTTQVIDTDVRVRAQEGSLRRVEQLLARAESLRDIIWIESQLTRRQAELDSLKSQQAWLADQTSDSTITIDIERKREAEVKKEKKDEPAGFLVGLKGGMKALGAFASAMATIVGALLPFAIVLAVFGVPMWLLVRRTARRRQTKQPATS
ncbi:DUF4349 domain-containing protein [Nocardioides sp.]|uniref:DUF4349 domain-containing protein n=1 Tax=Nocardioides sp. TaxID=35761 RepID=UPI002C1A1026|nr:DUF4349 domain-containing protein [Nocardioides sp.]HXH79018.1 DUF4349 domain-containing protein [Nocardioides sp.]